MDRTTFKDDKLVNKSRQNFERLLSAGILRLEETIEAYQVRKMLDPFPLDVVASDVFVLDEIPMDLIGTLGGRWVPCSRSFGPIIVDVNTVIGNDSEWGHIGDVMVIEGKHRLLDARERGEKTIKAYVGDLALRYFK